MKSTIGSLGFLLIAALLQCAVHAQQTCINPNENAGLCISVYDCPSLFGLLNRRSITQMERLFLRTSQCTTGLGRFPYVCCTEDTSYDVRSTTTTTTTTTTTRTPPINGDDSAGGDLLPLAPACGPLSFADKIYSGNDTAIDEFIWMALLEYTDPQGNLVINCGGSLINNRYVLTAAHCVKGEIEEKVGRLTQVRLGEYDLRTDTDCIRNVCNPPVKNIAIEETITHPQYNPASADRFHDIALIRLSQPVKLDAYIQPVCLPVASARSAVNANDDLVVSGWGRTLTARQSPIKQRLTIKVTEPQKCVDKFATRNINIGSSQICAGGEFIKDSCDGDSGGPLMRLGSVWYLEGVVSYGRGCGLENWPGVYTRVGNYMDWIEATIRP